MRDRVFRSLVCPYGELHPLIWNICGASASSNVIAHATALLTHTGMEMAVSTIRATELSPNNNTR